jgi:ABC-type transport system involved in cytochrome c biogenesis permease component
MTVLPIVERELRVAARRSSTYWSGLMFLYCLGHGRRSTADCLSEEKREGTLGLLFLTDLKGADIVLGKLAATSMRGFYGFLAVFPVLAIPLLLGGITWART